MNYHCTQVLDEFYENLKTVGVSAITGEGMEEMFGLVDECRDEYFKYYKAELDRRAKASLRLKIKPPMNTTVWHLSDSLGQGGEGGCGIAGERGQGNAATAAGNGEAALRY